MHTHAGPASASSGAYTRALERVWNLSQRAHRHTLMVVSLNRSLLRLSAVHCCLLFSRYLPNEVVMDTLMEEARKQCGIKPPGEEDDEEEEEAANDAGDAPVAPPTTALTLASLAVLQLGCGNSEITALLWDAGLRAVHNIDFSEECIERMQKLQKEHGWISDETDATAASPPASASSSAAPSFPLATGFVFRSMDVRALSYPSSSFRMVFDKGTMDCVVLESADGVASGRAAVREAWRVLQPGGVSVCFSLYPPTKRAPFWIEVLSEDEGGESAAEKAELCEVLAADNPPRELHTAAWSSLRMLTLDYSPLELPNQPHTYLYIATKR